MLNTRRVMAAVVLLVAVLGVPASAAGAAANRWPHVTVNGFSTPTGNGFWLTSANGAVATDGGAHFYGDASGWPLNGPVVGGAATSTGTGYWLVATDGGIFSFGGSQFYGSMGAASLNQPVFSMASTKSGRGYWLVARDGGIFSFGDARFYGSTGDSKLNLPIDGITTSATGRGYRMVARDGGIFSFGDARFYGSLPGLGIHVADIVGMAPTPTGNGYWIAGTNGRVYAFGDATNFGSYRPAACGLVVGIFSNPNSMGYRLVTGSGATIAFGSAPGGIDPTDASRCAASLLQPLRIALPTHTGPFNANTEFGTWIPVDGCKNARAVLLIHRSQAPVTYTSSKDCTVKTGRWTDPWSGAVTTVANDLDINHTVPMANAWRSGAWAWTHSQRVAYTNDVTDIDHLVPMLASENSAKDGRTPDAWRPPDRAAWCTYALVWDHIKSKWNLTATNAEWLALVAMAATC